MSIVAEFKSLLGVALLATLTSMAPVPAGDEGSDVCADVSRDYQTFEAEIEATKVALRKLESEGANEQALDAKRNTLADLIFRQDCVRPDLQPDPVRGPASSPQWISVNTYYATNRRPGSATGNVASYTAEREPVGIRYGRTTVSIPTRRQPGDLTLPKDFYLFELPADPSKHSS